MNYWNEEISTNSLLLIRYIWREKTEKKSKLTLWWFYSYCCTKWVELMLFLLDLVTKSFEVETLNKSRSNVIQSIFNVTSTSEPSFSSISLIYIQNYTTHPVVCTVMCNCELFKELNVRHMFFSKLFNQRHNYNCIIDFQVESQKWSSIPNNVNLMTFYVDLIRHNYHFDE